MSFDNLCKLLSEKYPDRFATWLLGQPPTSIKVLKTELSIEPIRADSITFLQTQERILHLEFQVKLESDPPLPLRMLDYWVRLYRLYRLPITQVVVFCCHPPRIPRSPQPSSSSQPDMSTKSCECGNKTQLSSSTMSPYCP